MANFIIDFQDGWDRSFIDAFPSHSRNGISNGIKKQITRQLCHVLAHNGRDFDLTLNTSVISNAINRNNPGLQDGTIDQKLLLQINSLFTTSNSGQQMELTIEASFVNETKENTKQLGTFKFALAHNFKISHEIFVKILAGNSNAMYSRNTGAPASDEQQVVKPSEHPAVTNNPVLTVQLAASSSSIE